MLSPKAQIFDRLGLCDRLSRLLKCMFLRFVREVKGTEFAKNLQTLRSVRILSEDAQ